MPEPRHQRSLFSQKLDRATFTAYFLGAVVPLIALAFVAQHYALPTLADSSASLGLVALVVSIAVLSLASFLALRTLSRRAIARMDGDNQRLEALLGASSQLATAGHLHEATATAATRALEITQAEAAYVLLRGDDKETALAATAGRNAADLYPKLERALGTLVELVTSGGRPALRGPADGSPRLAAVAVPLPGERGALGALVAVRAAPATSFDPEAVDALSTLAALSAVSINNADLRDAQRNFFAHVTDILVNALDSHLGFNAGHGNRVAQYANRMGRALELADDALQRLHFAALLHDLGMLKLDRTQQFNPKTCDKHATLGYRMLAPIRLWKDIAPIVHHHHEWFDGSGYPEGLAGEDIPIESRIIGLCDAFDTMTHESSYKATMTVSESLEELRLGSGTQFDPRLVQVFLHLVDQGVIDV
jgi:HD domain